MKAKLIEILDFLANGLPQADLDYLDKPALAALASQFRHWAIACDEAAKRPSRRAKAPERTARPARLAQSNNSSSFTLPPRISA